MCMVRWVTGSKVKTGATKDCSASEYVIVEFTTALQMVRDILSVGKELLGAK